MTPQQLFEIIQPMPAKMSRATVGTHAHLPPQEYVRPPVFDAENLIVTAIGEDGENLGQYHFSRLEGPRDLLLALVTGFAEGAKPGGRWTSRNTLKENSQRLARFFREIQVVAPDLTRLEDLTAAHWIQWREETQARSKWPGTINTARVILQLSPGLPEPVRQALQGRHRKPRSRTQVKEYSSTDYRRIVKAAWDVVNAATTRIRSSVRLLSEFREAQQSDTPLSPEKSRLGNLLEILALSGDLPRGANGYTSWAASNPFHRAGLTDSACNALFLEPTEVFAFMVLFTAARGYNPDTIDALTIEHQRPDGGVGPMPILNIKLRKLRAPKSQQEVSDNLVGRTERSAAGLMRLALELTEPARQTLRELGTPTNRLLVCRLHAPRKGQRLFVESINRTQASASWSARRIVTNKKDQPIRVTLQRVRLTEQGLNGYPRMNSTATHETNYAMPQAAVAEASENTIVAGLTEALKHAQATALIRILPREQYERLKKNPESLAEGFGFTLPVARDLVDGQLDTVLSACTDFNHSPFSGGGPCRASFLMCLACKNAVATPDHIPRLIALRHALENVASAVTTSVWDEDYADHYERLSHLLHANGTPEELSEAARLVTEADISALEALLSRRTDA